MQPVSAVVSTTHTDVNKIHRKTGQGSNLLCSNQNLKASRSPAAAGLYKAQRLKSTEIQCLHNDKDVDFLTQSDLTEKKRNKLWRLGNKKQFMAT